MALGSTQPLTEMSTRSISWGKGGQGVRLTTLPPFCAVVMKSGSLNFLERSEPFQVCNGTAFNYILLGYTKTGEESCKSDVWVRARGIELPLVRGTVFPFGRRQNASSHYTSLNTTTQSNGRASRCFLIWPQAVINS